MRLSANILDDADPSVERFGYDRRAQATGIVHLGVGAFHRAHQAVYTDRAMSGGDRDWSICGISLRSQAVCDQLMPQDGLYTVTERSGDGQKTSLIGAINRLLVSRDHTSAAAEALAMASVRIVTLTVTEKGYYGAVGGGLDVNASDIVHDLTDGMQKRTIYGLLAAAFALRRAAGLPGLTLLSCDNLADNGKILSANLSQFLERADPALADWFRSECATPASMVDRIVPATTDDKIADLENQIGFRDEAAVFTEPFSQWVIEDRFAGARPRWELGGAQFVDDVKPFETAKLRMLNGAHSALAYLGLNRGFAFVHEAIADPQIRATINKLMLDEAAPTLPPTKGLNPQSYADQLIERFSNAALAHRLDQIAMDGSQKIPQRWLHTLRFHQQKGQQCPAILEAFGAWLTYLCPGANAVADPLADRLTALWAQGGQAQIAAALVGAGGLFADVWTASERDIELINGHLRAR